jgi:hypothetical protein
MAVVGAVVCGCSCGLRLRIEAAVGKPAQEDAPRLFPSYQPLVTVYRQGTPGHNRVTTIKRAAPAENPSDSWTVIARHPFAERAALAGFDTQVHGPCCEESSPSSRDK